ncbi:ArsA-related P-loop ATPase [Lysinibacillus xylanilyticus]|uniref:ArsA-related P-loop ATPase n=1 Tax=Lysinibacillus xylanilyticus TaxID=582475 RepID=UPI003F6A0927
MAIAGEGKKVLLISTVPAPNLQDIFGQTLFNTPTKIEGIDNLFALNLDPEQAAQHYKEQDKQYFFHNRYRCNWNFLCTKAN